MPDQSQSPSLPDYVHLCAAGVSLLIRVSEGKPELIHWGADLGTRLPHPDELVGPVPPSSFDAPVPQHLLPEAAAGWLATPGLRASRNGSATLPRLTIDSIERRGETAVVIAQSDSENALAVRTELLIEPSGLLRIRHALRNTAPQSLSVEELLVTLPLPDRAAEILDTTGRWCREGQPQRRPIGFGKWSRPSRHGRTGHDAPLVFAVGTPGFGFRAGEVWSVHLAWSGNSDHYIEKLPSGSFVMGAGEILESGDVLLGEGETYESPWLFASHSSNGLDDSAGQFHAWDRAGRVAPAPRPVTLNSWEAVFFDHDIAKLNDLAEAGARIGAERFVLDDGWFRGRRDDTAGLGDWVADPSVWPDGLDPFITRVRGLGMQFGLWVEPEMINLDSDAARRHPEWISSRGSDVPLSWRHQQLLDLTNPAAWEHIRTQLDRLLTDHAIDYLKWDYNRDSTEVGHDGRPRTHAQVEAAYRLIDTIREAHPSVEIENCSSGGGRVDLEIAGRTDRTWISDSNDPTERFPIQRWALQLLPPERIGSHVGAPRSFTTGRLTDLPFRIGASWMHHMGIEWDIRQMTPSDEATLTEAVRLHKHYRDVLHAGYLIRADGPDTNHLLHGVVDPTRTRAVYQYAAIAGAVSDRPSPVQLPGLHPEWVYRVTRLLGDESLSLEDAPAPWTAAGATMSGRVLETIGLHMPLLRPQSALTLLAERIEA
ncbi:alpha-galactosidase [Leifsonia aquatica]|uniref:alpha-galactosidase n=1 Tax=Leifsonia aquatica TaxID=144185 RepID=UPI00046A7AB9|nr:alpha-galactosidase [Leifsonia aquatica]